MNASQTWPQISPVGLSGLLVRFGDKLDPVANTAAIACRAGLEAENWPEVAETASALASVILRIDLAVHDEAALMQRLASWLAARNWTDVALPEGRKLWSIPAVFGGVYGLPVWRVSARRKPLKTFPKPGCAFWLWASRRASHIWVSCPNVGTFRDKPVLQGRFRVARSFLPSVRSSYLQGHLRRAGDRSRKRVFSAVSQDPLRPGDEVRFVPVAEEDFEKPVWSEAIL